MHVNVAYPARYFAADHEQPVCVAHAAVAHYDVLRGQAYAPCVVVAARLDYHAVVALVEDAVFHEEVAGHLEVYAVIVVAVGVYVEVAHQSALAAVHVYGPERGVAYLEAVEHDVTALVEVYHVRAQVVLPLGHVALRHGQALVGPVVESRQGVHVGLGAAEPRAPRGHVGR